MQTPTYADDTSLTLKVLPSRPVLAIDQSTLPDRLLAGEYGTATLTLANRGKTGLSSLRILCDNPPFILYSAEGSPGVHALSLISLLRQAKSLVTHTAFNGRIPSTIPDDKPSRILLQDGTLSPGDQVDVPVHFRGSSVGLTIVRCLFVFEGTVGSEAEKRSNCTDLIYLSGWLSRAIRYFFHAYLPRIAVARLRANHTLRLFGNPVDRHQSKHSCRRRCRCYLRRQYALANISDQQDQVIGASTGHFGGMLIGLLADFRKVRRLDAPYPSSSLRRQPRSPGSTRLPNWKDFWLVRIWYRLP